MKLRKVICSVASVAVFALLATSCGSKSTTKKQQTTKGGTPIVTTKSGATTKSSVTTKKVTQQTTTTEESESSKITKLKAAALAKLDEIVNPVIARIKDTDLKNSVQGYYDAEKQYINGINDLQTAKDAVNKVIADTDAFAVQTLKPIVVEKIDAIVSPLIDAITYTDLKTSVELFYEDEMDKVDDIETLKDAIDVLEEIVDDTKKFIKTGTEKVIIALKNEAIEELDGYVTALIAKIPYSTLKNDTQEFYNTEKNKLEAVDTIEGIAPCVEKIKEDLENYALTEIKKIAISELNDLIDAGLEKIPYSSLKEDLTDFKDIEIAKLNAVTKVEDVPTTLETVLEETAAYIKQLLATVVKDYIRKLTAIESATAYDYIPEAMAPYYEGNKITDPSSIDYDFTSFTNLSSIQQVGFGEQWQMVVENINQSIAMAKVFNVAQTVLTSAGEVVDTYLTNSYADEMNYEFSGSGYTGLFTYSNGLLKFYVTMTTSVDVPVIGSVKPVIKMEYDLTKDAKGMFISLGDSFKIKYVITSDSYEMATTYGLSLIGHEGTRSSLLTISKQDGRTTGHIYEFTTLDGEDKVSACADFYVDGGYVSVVGNKASGMKFFEGFVSELYSASTGRLLGYEVKEEKTITVPVIGDISGIYNTLWFNLWDISGINNLKIAEKTSQGSSDRRTIDVYLNNSTDLFIPTYNTKNAVFTTVQTSRKYDIEYRSRFYYTYDDEKKEYIAHEVLVPMMFIQAGDNLASFEEDIEADNGIDASVLMSQSTLTKIEEDYEYLIPAFENNKDLVNSDTIDAYLAQYE